MTTLMLLSTTKILRKKNAKAIITKKYCKKQNISKAFCKNIKNGLPYLKI